MVGWEADMYRRAVSYISQADALNFLLNLHTWSWYARVWWELRIKGEGGAQEDIPSFDSGG